MVKKLFKEFLIQQLNLNNLIKRMSMKPVPIAAMTGEREHVVVEALYGPFLQYVVHTTTLV